MLFYFILFYSLPLPASLGGITILTFILLTDLSVVIDKKDHKIVLTAPKYGLEELSYEEDELQVLFSL